MVVLAPIANETPAWDVLDTFPKLHSRAREAKTTPCTEVPMHKSRNCIEIWLTIYETCDRLESFTRDPIGFKSLCNNFYSFVWGRSLSKVDPSGLFDDVPKPVVHPPHYAEYPGWTNCAGFAIHPDKVAVNPLGGLIDLFGAFGFKNCSIGSSALKCLENCEKKSCIQAYVYIPDIITDKYPNFDYKAELEKLVPEFSFDEKVKDVETMLLYHWIEVWEKLRKRNLVSPGGNTFIDFHVMKCTGKQFEYQPCRAKFGADGSDPENSCVDRRSDPKIFVPTKDHPDMFAGRSVAKVCCCKDEEVGVVK